MATLICNGTGNITGASTFAAVETGALAAVLNRNTLESLANNAAVTSATFTVTNAKVIDGVLLWIRQAAAGSTGTFKVDLQKGGVSQASVTVNRADLPSVLAAGNTIGNVVPVLFKLTSTATGDGGSNWTIVLTNNNGTNAVHYAAATASTTNFTRALRTTTAATPGAADDLYVVGEFTGAGTNTPRTVTMDQTANTAYGNGTLNSTTVAGGGIHVGAYGTLSYGTSASTNYVLRVNGDLIVYEFGTLNIGSSGAEIPRTSTAVLEFQMASAAIDFGLRMLDNSTTNIAGLSRTSGKNIVKCKLTADLSSATALGGGVSGFNINLSSGAGITDSSGSLAAIAATDVTANSGHFVWTSDTANRASTTQTFAVWLARGSGTNNRFVRVAVGTSASVTFSNGFYVDVDLQAGTVGTVTAVGNGTATSASIAAVGNGYLVKITGKCSSGTSQPIAMLMACNASGVTSYLGDATTNFLYDHLALVNASSISDTTLSVDTDTGWLSGDGVCVAGTNRYAALENEGYILNANAGASSLVSSLYPFNTGGVATHSGTSPTQAEVGLVTRNVKIRSTSAALRSYVYATNLASVNFSWAEFYFLGSSTLNKYGMAFDFGSTATAKTVTFCSIHDTYYGFVANSGTATSLNLTYTNNVLWNVNGSGANGFVLSAFTNQDLTFTDNLLILSVGAGWSTQPGTYTFNNNTFVGCASWGVTLGNSGATTNFAAWSGNTIHSCGGGWNIGSAQCNQTAPITFANWAIWRNSSNGLNWGISIMIEPIIFDTWTMFGNSTANISLASGGYYGFTMKNSRMSADTTFATTSNFSMVSGVTLDLMIDTLDTSVTGIYAAVTNEFKSQAFDIVNIVAKNCKWGGTNLLDTSFRANMSHNMIVANERYSQTAGDHRCEMYYGQLKTDTTFYNTASPSMRMTPNNASNKLESAPKNRGMLKKATNGQTTSISIYIRKSAAGDGAAYNGNQPRLIQRANAALGQSSDVVLATYSASTGSWNQLTGTSSTATDDGMWEFVVDCDGTAGWINVDDWA